MAKSEPASRWEKSLKSNTTCGSITRLTEKQSRFSNRQHRRSQSMSSKPSPETKPGSVSLADEEAVKQVLSSAVFGLWDIVNNLSRLRSTKRERYRVTIFGSARAKPGTFAYDEVKRLAAALAEMGCDIVTGGGPGLMQAANEGAAAVNAPERNRSVGIRVDLPFEQEVNPFVEEAFEHKTFF